MLMLVYILVWMQGKFPGNQTLAEKTKKNIL